MTVKLLAFSKSRRGNYDASDGYTLIELIVVILVIGVLATVSFSILSPKAYFERGRNAKRKSDLEAVAAALEQYYLDNSRIFPDSIDSTNLGPYLKSADVLTDPKTGNAYMYDVADEDNGIPAGASSYKKCFSLDAADYENGNCSVCGGSLTCQNVAKAGPPLPTPTPAGGFSCSCP